MNKAELLSRIEQIKTDMNNAVLSHTALTSHLNECNFWLTKYDELEKEQDIEDAEIDQTTDE